MKWKSQSPDSLPASQQPAGVPNGAKAFSNAVLVLLACFSCFALVFGFTTTRPGGNAVGMWSGIILSAAFLGALFLRPEWKLNLCLVALSVLLTAYGMEVLLSVWKISVKNTLDAAEEMQARGIDAVPRLLPANFLRGNGIKIAGGRLYPLGLVSNKITVLCNENGYWATFLADEHGFNNPAGTFQQREPDIALIGDSYTLGSCVREGEDVASHLRAAGYTAINLGTGGIGPLFELAMVTEYVLPLKPRIVLWLYYEGNDLVNLDQERQAPLLMSYLREDFSQNLINRQPEIDAALTAKLRRYMIQAFLRLDRLRSVVDAASQAAAGEKPSLTIHPLRDPELFSSIMTKAQARTRAAGGTLYFVYLPSFKRYDGSHDVLGDKAGELFDKAGVLKIVQRLAIPVVDFSDTFAKTKDPLALFPFRRYGHYTTEGYALLAKQIADHLRELNAHQLVGPHPQPPPSKRSASLQAATVSN